ncbi:short-chain dehydrogenase [Leptospira perolatii]|uniref:Short-chain dehydrogenase n=1 Tax=Leptospira perolatii TaxID=2023191 RepID=A0A2M9ZM67_9LEPT|nr:SDR family oxidoreductase [Leptospira perolatii]PJZ69846.1 short-chain dehydrogenase [Leptospira perolatii]PJZ73172.1 short-chain dehydrogenase [Leptospira perolatii]
MKDGALLGKVALVAGGTRGAGRGISIALGEKGATVYVTGRSSAKGRSDLNRPETIEETAELVTRSGGKGIPVRVDHTNEYEVKELFEKIRGEQSGRLDVLINDIWGGEHLIDWGKKFWEHDLHNGLKAVRNCIDSHLVTSRFALPFFVQNRTGLLIEITDGTDYRFRGNVYYSLVKSSLIHLAECFASELKPYGVTVLALTPGFLRSEAMLDYFKVKESNWRDAAKQDPHFLQSETPMYIGRAVACLAGDPEVKGLNGQALSTWKLSEKYDFTDIDGSRPHWGKYYEKLLNEGLVS